MHLDILIFSAHPDDAELAMGGTILKHRSLGHSIGIVDLTQGELGSRGTKETRYIEAQNASKILDIQERVNLKMADGFFQHSEENLRLVVEQIRRFQPKVVFCNAFSDRHPDHGKGSRLVSEACFLAGLRRIETTWNNEIQTEHRPKAVYHYIQDHYLKPDFVIDVSDFVDKKMEAILAYKTQFYDPNSKEPTTPISTKHFQEYLKGRLIEMGRQAGYDFGEGFQVERIPGVKTIFDLD